MKLIFEKSHTGAGGCYIPESDVPAATLPDRHIRHNLPHLPELSETEISRHYTLLAQRTFGVNNGFYPLGSCTMKYNPRINEKIAALDGFRNLHPLQSEETIQGALEILHTAERYFCEITGMDNMTFQPSAGAHGELTGVLLIKAYHRSRGDAGRTKVLVPDSAHGTNPATAAMAGFTVITVPSGEDGCVDLDALSRLAGDDTAGIMLTNPNTLGLFDKNIEAITGIIHKAGGLAYYDGANLNAIMGVARPGDMNFDIVHLNLHKTFSTPHGGGGPGSGPVGCKAFLSGFLPGPICVKEGDVFRLAIPENSIGRMKSFYGNFLVVVRALAYVMTLGSEGIRNSCEQAVLNANYMKKLLEVKFDSPFRCSCMHEFVLSLEKLKNETGVSALDFAKALLDEKIHPPTMYFPLIVHEALMLEPTETESKETMDEVVAVFNRLHDLAYSDPAYFHTAPHTTVIKRPNEVEAARNPRLRY
ncbi:MAG: aminomethyl-transferring glycine dehydrogenase subunit GcvPB [Saccharofermentanales bacterium]